MLPFKFVEDGQRTRRSNILVNFDSGACHPGVTCRISRHGTSGTSNSLNSLAGSLGIKELYLPSIVSNVYIVLGFLRCSQLLHDLFVLSKSGLGDSMQQYSCHKGPLLGNTQSSRGRFWATCCIQSRPLVAATFTSGHFPMADIRDRIGINHFRYIPDCLLSRPGSYLIPKVPSRSPVCLIGYHRISA